jgi:hypothetical protein
MQKPPVRALSARELGRLFAAAEGEDWIDKRNTAILALMAKAGLRVGRSSHWSSLTSSSTPDPGGPPSGWARATKRAASPSTATSARRCRPIWPFVRPSPRRPFRLPDRVAAFGPRRPAPGGGAGPAGADRGEGHAAHPAPHLCHAAPRARRGCGGGGGSPGAREHCHHVRYLHPSEARLAEAVEGV